ncbi:vacuolar protein sorting-associated protein 32 homolog 1-like isoform X2 [Wolffia australiana]
MFWKFFSACTGESGSRSSTSRELQKTFEMLEKKEATLQQKILVEVERAKEFTKANKKQAALQFMKRKRYYEAQMEQIWDLKLQIHEEQKQSQKHGGCHR